MFDLDVAEAYLDRRFANEKGYVALAVGLGGRFDKESGRYKFNSWVEHQYSWPDSKEQLLSHIKALEVRQADIYICPVLRKDEGRDKWNGLESRTVFADLDGGEIPTALLPYTELVNSGTAGHFHAYITLTDRTDLSIIEALNYAVAKVSKGDASGANNRVLRLPGTANFKQSQSPVSVVQLQCKEITLDQLMTILVHYLPKHITPYPTDAELDAIIEIPIPVNLDPYIQTRLLDDNEGDRSRKSYHFIIACLEKGMSTNLAYSLALLHEPTVSKYGGRRGNWNLKHQVLELARTHTANNIKMAEGWALV